MIRDLGREVDRKLDRKQDRKFGGKISQFRFPLLLAMCVILSGCSIKTAYNNMDRLILWGVSDYVNLNRAQKAAVREGIATINTWHRQNHLPLYAEFTETLALQASDQITAARMAEVVNQLEVWSDEIEAQFTPLIIEVMVSLDDEQIADIPKKLNAANAEFAEEEADLSLDEAQALWAEEFAESMDNLVGKLTSEQLAFLQRKRAEYQPERVLWADYRSRWQADLLALLAERDAAEFPERYRALVAAREGYYGEELTAIFDNNERLNRETGAYLMSNLTDKQTQRFVKFLSDLSETFSELAQEA